MDGAPADGSAIIKTKDDGDVGGAPALGTVSVLPVSISGGVPGESFGGVGRLTAAAEDPPLLAICLALALASVPAREAFCRSLPDVGTRARCWKYRWNRAEWIGWCYAEFS